MVEYFDVVWRVEDKKKPLNSSFLVSFYYVGQAVYGFKKFYTSQNKIYIRFIQTYERFPQQHDIIKLCATHAQMP